MTDQWVPAPPVVPPPPSDPLPPANSWNPTPPCTSGDNPSIVDGVVITGVPATISAPYAWSITLNDGNSPPNFSLNRNDGSNALIDQPIQASGVDGSVLIENLSVPGVGNLKIPGGPPGTYLGSVGGGNGLLTWFTPVINVDAPTDGPLYGRTQGVWATGGTFTQPLYLQGSNMFGLVGPAGSQRALLGGTGSTIPPPQSVSWRWQMTLGNATQETGSNQGSDFAITPISDTGGVLPTAFTIYRATGQAVFSQPLTVQGPIGNTPALMIPKSASGGTSALMGASNAGIPRWQLSLANPNAELGNNLGSNFQLDYYTDAGALAGSALTIARNSGVLTIPQGMTVNGPAGFNNLLALNNVGNLSIPGGQAGDTLLTDGQGLLSWGSGGGGGGIADAPFDGTTYARNDANWVHLVSADISDLATLLTQYLPLMGGTISGPLTVTGATNVAGITTSGLVNAASMFVQGNSVFTGNVTVPAPTIPTQAANKSYVDGLAGTTPPLMDGTVAVGVGTTWARTDHVHPTDTSLYPASNPSGYQTAAQVAAVLPPASTVIPLTDGVGAVGTSAAYARADHVHPVAMGDNRIINGDMRIDQRNNGASGAGVGYTVDRWAYSAAQSGKGAWQRVTGGAGIQVLGFGYVLQFISSSAYTPLASDNFCFYQMIEADMMADFAWGTAGAQPVTLSFIVNSSLTGTFGGVIRNQPGPPTRSYPVTFSIPVANTWTKIAITIPGDTAGAWVLQGNAAGLQLMFDLGSGATLRGPANAWAAANYFGATGSVSVVGTNAATFNVTGVKLEIGSVATPFNRQSLAKSMADCQRYYETGTLTASANGTTAAAFVMMGSFNAFKRAVPTVTPTNAASNGVNATPNAFTITQQAFAIYHLATATAICSFTDTWIASAEL